MKQVRINVSEMLHKIQEDVKRLVKGFSDVDIAAYAMGQWVPKADVLAGPAELRILVDLPGIAPDAVDVSVTGGILKVSGEKPSGFSGAELKAVSAERRAGRFSRSFELPAAVQTDAVHATMRDGLLQISLPKKADSMEREIKVEVR